MRFPSTPFPNLSACVSAMMEFNEDHHKKWCPDPTYSDESQYTAHLPSPQDPIVSTGSGFKEDLGPKVGSTDPDFWGPIHLDQNVLYDWVGSRIVILGQGQWTQKVEQQANMPRKCL